MRRLALLSLSLLILTGCDGGGSSSSSSPVADTCPEAGSHACKAGDSEPLYTFQWALNHAASFFRPYREATEGGLDLNVEAVHRQGIKGQGVNVLVLDSGTDFKHEDLAPNADLSKSKNLVTLTPDPFPSDKEIKDPSSAHGTVVAGIIGAAQNGKGIMGIAPRVTLGAANLLDAALVSDAETVFEAYGGAEWSRTAHVINASYGKGRLAEPYEQGTTFDTFAIRSLKGLRSQRGALYIKAAGNDFEGVCQLDGADHHPCVNPANDVEALEPNAIVVAALNARGQRSSYSSAGPVVWITGMGGEYGKAGIYGEGNGPVDGPTIFAPDITGCTRGLSQHQLPPGFQQTPFILGQLPENPDCDYAYMNGTSSAAPTISGVVSLMLSANPALSWRDVRDILRQSARKVDPLYTERRPGDGRPSYGALLDLAGNTLLNAPGTTADIADGNTQVPLNLGWQRNGAGLEYSDWYGFGVPDAARAVALAQDYARNPALGRGHDVRFEPFQEIAFWHKGAPRAKPRPGDLDFPAGFPYKKVSLLGAIEGGDGLVDEFQVRLSLQGVCLGSVGIAVRSPAGTVSMLKQPLDHFVEDGETFVDSQNYAVGSYAFYGEPAAGGWDILAVSADPDQPPFEGNACSADDGAGAPRTFQLLSEARIIKQ